MYQSITKALAGLAMTWVVGGVAMPAAAGDFTIVYENRVRYEPIVYTDPDLVFVGDADAAVARYETAAYPACYGYRSRIGYVARGPRAVHRHVVRSVPFRHFRAYHHPYYRANRIFIGDAFRNRHGRGFGFHSDRYRHYRHGVRGFSIHIGD